jgi:hypothetical protein
MESLNPDLIDLSKISEEIRHHEHEWLAISSDNIVVASGRTYGEAAQGARAKGRNDMVLFKVPPLDVSLAP